MRMPRCGGAGGSVGGRACSDRADLRRRHLLDTARALFVRNGFHQTGIAQIAAASGIGVGQIYRDFDGKERIIAAICETDVAAWLEEDVLCAAVAAHDADAIRAWIRRFGAHDEPLNECRMMAEIVAESARNERIATLHREIDLRVRARLTAALTALASGADRDDDIAMVVEFILAIGIGVMTRRTIDPAMKIATVTPYIGALIDRELAWLARPEDDGVDGARATMAP